ncbi:DUF2382 domain-containing protein [Ramlibacter henchirensis]|uniref:DUF2382 domain-containing protein n=1 Tax=Ramlibacter henchirensis TaxID=204072 RepID=A0A4Z0C4X1_9BURK|nr:DUF2382 domain-containing protein [Ramlibacter henchirensis]
MGPLSTQPPRTSAAPSPTPGTTIPVTEEQVEIGRRTVDSGRPVRVRKHVDEEQVRAEVAVAREAVDVERVPIGRVVDAPPSVRREGDVTVVPVIEERLVTRKELVLVEEIRLTRRREVAQAQEDLTLRRERVVVERFDPDTGQWLPEGS